MLTMDDARARVARGAALLDAQRPGWAQRIDHGRLDLGNECHCILGQLESSYSSAIARLGLRARATGNDTTVAHGFDLCHIDGRHRFALLQDAWIEAIADRLHPVAPEPETSTACV